MNRIDQDFYQLVAILQNKKKEEILDTIKQNFLQLPVIYQDYLEDYLAKYKYWGNLDHKRGDYGEIEEKALSFHEHIEDYIWLYESFVDYRSKMLLYAMMKNWYQYDFNSLKEATETTYSDYFDLDIIKCDKEEVVVDLGAYVGDTVFDYLRVYGEDNYKKIYCYEITKEVFGLLKENVSPYSNIECRRKAVGGKDRMVYVEESKGGASANVISGTGTSAVEEVTLDQDITEKITLLKMDIEGAEQSALRGSEKHIREDHPKLLLSVYHNNEDIWKIPRMIDEICKGYQFYLRSHSGRFFPTEITLLAVYKEKE